MKTMNNEVVEMVELTDAEMEQVDGGFWQIVAGLFIGGSIGAAVYCAASGDQGAVCRVVNEVSNAIGEATN